jgi:hypothetical protein
VAGERDFVKAENLLQKIEIILSKISQIPDNLWLRHIIMKAAILDRHYNNSVAALNLLEKDITTALKLKNFPEEQLMFFSQISQIYLQLGDLKRAEGYLNLSNLIIKRYDEIGGEDAFYTLQARMEIAKGNTADYLYWASAYTKIALKKINSIPGELPFISKVPVLALNIEIMIRKELFLRANLKAKALLRKANRYIKNHDHVYLAQIKILLGKSYLGIGNIELAEKEAIGSAKILNSSQYHKQSKYKFDTLLLLAAIYSLAGDPKKVQESLLEAKKIAKVIYKQFQTDDLSQMYKKLVKNSLALNKVKLAEYYYSKHKEYFGLTHRVTLKLGTLLFTKFLEPKNIN